MWNMDNGVQGEDICSQFLYVCYTVLWVGYFGKFNVVFQLFLVTLLVLCIFEEKWILLFGWDIIPPDIFLIMISSPMTPYQMRHLNWQTGNTLIGWSRWFLVCIDHHYQSFSERSADLLELIIFQFASIIFVIFCLVFQ